MKLNFSSRVSLFVMALTTLMFCATLGVVYVTASYYLYNKTIQEAERTLDLTSQRIKTVQFGIETIANTAIPHLKEHIGNEEELQKLTKQIVSTNPILASMAIGFKPYYFAGKEHCVPFAIRLDKDNSIEKADITPQNYGNYFCMDWFQIPFLLKQAYWTEPYENLDHNPIVSYVSPITNEADETVAVLSLDIRLSQFTQLVKQAEDETENYLFGRRGNVLVAPHQQLLMRETLFTLSEMQQDTALWNIGLKMINGQNGMGKIKGNATPSYILYKPIGEMGWSTAIIIPENIISHSIHSVSFWTIIATISGLILTYLFCFLLIRRLTSPLKTLTHSAELLSAGNFDTPLPNIKRQDEIKHLCNAFEHMQRSLKNSISNLTVERDRAEHANRVLSIFIRNIGGCLRTPLNGILGFSSLIVDDIEKKPEEVKLYGDIISTNCQTINYLLNKLVELADLESEKEMISLIPFGSRDIYTSVLSNISLKGDFKNIPIHTKDENHENTSFETDPLRLEQLLTNLLKSLVEMKPCEQITVSHSATLYPGNITFTLSSVGKSLPIEETEVLFQNIAQWDFQKNSISSLELYLTYMIAQKLKCKLYMDTTYKGGNSFVLIHPLKYTPEK